MDLKNLITTIAALLAVIVSAVQAYFQSIGTGEINWFQLAMAVIFAVVAYLTGKNANLTKKTPTQVAEQTKLQVDTKVK